MAVLTWLGTARAVLPPEWAPLLNFDKRAGAAVQALAERHTAAGQLQSQLPGAEMDFDAQSGSPKWVHSREGFLTGPGGQGRGVSPAALAGVPAGESHRALKAFLNEHSKLFGHGAEALSGAKVKREFVTARNGLQTTVWEQELDGIPVFEGLLTAHTTASGELVSVASGFMANPSLAADRGTAQRAQLQVQPAISAAQAVALAAQEVGVTLGAEAVTPVEDQAEGATLRQHFRAPGLNGETEAGLVWLPLDESRLRLCWEVILTSRSRGEMFRVLLDAQTGEALVRQCLTNYLSEASYRVYTSDSPSPFSPGWSTPDSNQPPVVVRTLVTLSALDTNASPNGWMDDGVNETRGNNVDAHTDRNGDNLPDLPRPQGLPYRVFDFALDLSQSPTAYTNAAVVQLFYWNNFIHDKLYQLGFTEAAGNFQNNNFGRGGLGDDAVQADAQDGSGSNNANFSTPPDGSAGRMQMFLFTGAAPYRDGDLDAEMVLHEYTHGLSNRRVGNGVGLSALQSVGLGEGWSDFYALSLLSEAGDDPNGVYASGGYTAYLMHGLSQNYYFGIRRYPYCTDLSKNPLTFKDIDPTQASTHSGVPRSPIVGSTANEVHNMGEVWCVALWEARANLVGKHGGAVGNQLMLQLVTDGMNLSPANPTFLQARDAILQADQVDTGGANQVLLWAAFAKRGLGTSATSPASSSTYGVKEAYDMPDSLSVSPALLSASGPVGGPFTPSSGTFLLTNTGSAALNWSLGSTCVWLNVSPGSGTLAPGGAAASVEVSLADGATNLSLGISRATLWFTNQTSGVVQAGTFVLSVVGQHLFDDFEPDIDLSQWSSFGGVVGSTVLATNYGGSVSGPNALWFGDGGSRFATTMPLDTSRGGLIAFSLRLANGSAWPWEVVDVFPGEGVVLEASTDSGVSWSTLGTYDTTAYYSWTAVSLEIPAEAQSPATLFRWRQLSHSGSAYDHWALDNVNIVAGPLAPVMASQPQSQTAVVGEDVVLSVLAYGSVPMSYQWRLNGNDLSGATTSSLEFTNVGFGDAGTYSVLVSNSVGVLLSSNAVLTVNPPPPCTPVPAGLVSWWRGQGDATDFVGAHNGTLSGGVTFSRGEAGQGFVLDGSSASVNLGNWFNLQVFSVALWVKAGVAQMTYADLIDNNHRDSPWRSWTVEYQNTGLRFAWDVFTLNSGYISLPFDLKANTWQYLVLTLDESRTARVYLDGQLQGSTNLIGAVSYDGTESLWLGRWVGGARYFNGSLDEVDVYNRALAPVEIQALYNSASSGKCMVESPPVILTQPVDQTVVSGGEVVFNVLAGGTQPLSYQWQYNGLALSGATKATLSLTNVQLGQAGTYSVWVSNRVGFELSSNAVLTVNPPPPCTPVPAGLVSWWRAEGDGSDFLGLNHGVLTNGASCAAGRVGQAFNLNGVNQYVFIPDSASLRPTSVSLEGWFKFADTPDVGLLCGKAYGSSIYDSYSLWYESGTLRGAIATSSGFGPELMYAWSPVLGTWYHIAYTFDASSKSQALYLNGVVVASGSVSGPIAYDTHPVLIGADTENQSPSFFFKGQIDEVSLYNRALSASEVQALYAANAGGKCAVPTPPTITVQPTNQAAFVGETVSWSVAAVGTPPMTYQWQFNGLTLTGATNATLSLTNVQLGQAGTYSVWVSNSVGFELSSNAVLTVNAPSCVAPPAGLVSWWRAENNALDSASGNNGTLVGNVTYGAGEVGQGFVCGGSGSYIQLANATNLQLQNLTIEMWLRRASASLTTADGTTGGDLFGYGYGGYAVGTFNDGGLIFSKVGISSVVSSSGLVTGTNFHHVAVTKSGSTVVFYVDGVAYPTPAYNPGFTFSGAPIIGGLPGYANSFWGTMDEVSVYNRGLSAAEIRSLYQARTAGKCAGVPPTISGQPTNQSTVVGGTAVFTVTAVGTLPLSYQWLFNSAALPGATNASLTLTNVQLGQAGTYAVRVSNLAGSVRSSNAVLAVNLMPPSIVSQPANQSTLVGSNVTFSATATGTPPLGYQWWFNGAPLAGQTANQLTLWNVQMTNAGTYNLLVTNAAGSVLSSNAVLTVFPPPSCMPPLAGLVAWWRAEGNAYDQLGTNNGTLAGNATYAAGRVGQAFAFGGANGDGVRLNNLAGLQVQDLTIEAWVKRASTTQATRGPYDGGQFFGFGSGGYCFNLAANGQLGLSKTYYNQVTTSAGLLSDTNWHHVAVTKSGSTVVFYVDGVAYPVAAYNPGFTFTTSPAIGSLGNLTYSFWGAVDDLAVYNRPLSATEIQGLYAAGSAGKCVVAIPPQLTLQPVGQNLFVGDEASFSVGALGTAPLGYQWQLNGSALPGATNPSLVLTNLQLAQAGTYTVLVTNAGGSTLSSNAVLVVNPPPPCTPMPAGLLSWWRAEGDGADFLGLNPGRLTNGAGFAAGRVGQAFTLNGVNQYVAIADNPSLRPSSLTVEGWFNFASAPGLWSLVGKTYGSGIADSFGLWYESGTLRGVISTTSGLGPELTYSWSPVVGKWYHLAYTFDAASQAQALYVNGAVVASGSASGPIAYDSHPVLIGADTENENPAYFFKGQADEVSLYSRALAPSEVLALYNARGAGKCAVPPAPFIASQPASQAVAVGETATFTLLAGGCQPLSYQWRFNNADLPGATQATLLLTNVQRSQAGSYAVVVSNAVGMVLSSNAVLTVTRANPVLFDSMKDFSPNANPAGPWSYGFSTSLGSPMYLFLEHGNDSGADFWRTNLWPGVPVLCHNGTANAITIGSSYLRPGDLFLQPGASGQYCVLRFTAPSNACYQVRTIFWGADTVGATTDVHILTNGLPFFDGVVDGIGLGTGPTNVSSLLLKAGDSLDFAVGPGTSGYNSDNTGVWVQIGVNHPPSAGTFNGSTRQNVPLSLLVEKLLLSAADPDDDPLTLSAVSATSTNGGYVVLNAGAVIYIPPFNFMGVDRFSYTVRDALGESASGFVVVHVWSADLPYGTMLPVVPMKEGYQVTFVGIPGSSYSLQRALSVKGPWLTIATVLPDSSGIGTFLDTNAPPGEAFYRTTYP